MNPYGFSESYGIFESKTNMSCINKPTDFISEDLKIRKYHKTALSPLNYSLFAFYTRFLFLDNTQPPVQQAQRKKKSSGKKKSSASYEHHLEQWLQNSSMNMDYLNEYNYLQNQSQSQVPAFNAINNNTARNRHLLTGDPASLPSHFVSLFVFS